MQAGLLRHRITIQVDTESQNGFGEITRTWADYVTVWASVEPFRGREYLAGKQIQAAVNTRIRMRYRSDITPGSNRVTWGSHTYDIADVIHDPRRVQLELMCTEVL